MVRTYLEDREQQGVPSSGVWKTMPPPESFSPLGSTSFSHSGNPAFGFYDNFHSFQATTAEGPYLILEGTGCTVEQINCTDAVKGIVELSIDGDADNDAIALQWGRGLGAPFKLADKDLAFEACIALDAVTASKWDIFLGLADVAAGGAATLFADAGDLAATCDCLGFSTLAGDATACHFDGSYQDADGDHIRGDTKTKLNALHEPVADTYVRLGFRYLSHPESVEWYVNGTLVGGINTPARLTQSECQAADFPNDVLLTPIIGAKDQSGTTSALDINIDWWACAQYL